VRGVVCLLLVLGVANWVRAQAVPPDAAGSQAAAVIQALLERRVVDTDPDGLFRPHAAVSRARFVRWLAAAKGLAAVQPDRPTYPDVPPSHPDAPFVEAAWRHGLLPEEPRFRPQEALRWKDAVDWVVRALGYRWEAEWLASRADGGAADPALLLAASLEPPLVEQAPAQVRPEVPTTRAQAARLLWAYLRALEGGVRLRYEQALAPGLSLVVEKRGALRTLPVWRVQVGAFANPENARRLASQMRAQGWVAFVDEVDGLHKVRVGSFATRREAEQVAERLRQDGLATWVLSTVRDLEKLAGPQWVASLRVDPNRLEVRPVLARDRVPGRERTSQMARRAGALAAVNGGFFAPDGDPLGGLVVDGEWVSEPLPGRSCLGLADGLALVDTLDWRGEVVGPFGSVRLSGLNRPPAPGEVVLYTPRYGASTRTDPAAVEVVVAGGAAQQVRAGGGSSVPPDGFVLSARGDATAALQQVRVGDPLRLSLRLQPASGDPRWDEVRHVVCGGPRLVAAGLAAPSQEGFPDAFRNRRHPRTAAGVATDGTLVLLVVDGRWPEHGLGMTLEELARELVSLGVRDALNLDGGGSTTLVVGGVVANRPSDEAGERPVSDALVVRPRAGSTPPSRPAGRWEGTGRPPWPRPPGP
jgi:cell division septation protein DedD